MYEVYKIYGRVVAFYDCSNYFSFLASAFGRAVLCDLGGVSGNRIRNYFLRVGAKP